MAIRKGKSGNNGKAKGGQQTREEKSREGSVECGPVNLGSEVAVLHHRKEKDRTLVVRIDSDCSVATAYQSSGNWVVPCDIVGVEGKKLKNVRVRLHPDTLARSETNALLAKAVEKFSEEAIISVLDDEWSLSPVKRADARLDTVRKLRRLANVVQPSFEYTAHSIDFAFPLVACDKKDRKAVEEGRACLGKGKALVVEVEKQGSSVRAQLTFRSDSLSRALWSAEIAPADYVDCDSEVRIEICSHSLRLRVPRANPDSALCPPESASVLQYTTFDHCGNVHAKKMESLQEVVDELRARLDSSLGTFGRASEQKGRGRRIGLVSRDSTESVFCIGEMPLQLARPPLSPLAVEVSLPPSLSLASSPAGSEDSGVGGSPAGSPKTPPPLSPFYSFAQTGRAALRQRSYSENCPGLVGILKWPQARTTFARSVSECHPDEREVRALSSSPSATNTIDIDDDRDDEREPGTLASRKKRVSFSETVDLRTFRKGSCIEAARRKAEKNKLRRERKRLESNESLSETDPFDEMEETKEKGKGGLRTQDRQDSGFCEEEDADRDPEQSWMRMVRTQRQRWSSESAVL